jgi:hypothetical protein
MPKQQAAGLVNRRKHARANLRRNKKGLGPAEAIQRGRNALVY